MVQLTTLRFVVLLAAIALFLGHSVETRLLDVLAAEGGLPAIFEPKDSILAGEVALADGDDWDEAVEAAAVNGILLKRHKHKKHKPFFTPHFDLFIQERASKGLPGPGQHLDFGALRPWPEILDLVHKVPERKLLLIIRHGQAVSNWLEAELGPDDWFQASQSCEYKTKDGITHGVFDAELRPLGEEQAQQLNLMLNKAGWYHNLTDGAPARALVSPLSRCLQTAQLVMDGLPIGAVNVEETCRETLGEDTCDARRSASDPSDIDNKHKKHTKQYIDCNYKQGLRSKFPAFHFPVGGWDKTELGLFTDEDRWWTANKRERQKHQVKRAKKFLEFVFANVPEKIVFVVTHSGFTRSILLAVGREPYRPANGELVPAVVESRLQPDLAVA